MELALPSEINAAGFVVDWEERVVLDPVPFTSPDDSESETDDSDDDDLDHTTTVERR